MTKPEDIPQDVWDKASMAVVHAPEYTLRLHEDVARAILAAEARAICAMTAEAAILNRGESAKIKASKGE